MVSVCHPQVRHFSQGIRKRGSRFFSLARGISCDPRRNVHSWIFQLERSTYHRFFQGLSGQQTQTFVFKLLGFKAKLAEIDCYFWKLVCTSETNRHRMCFAAWRKEPSNSRIFGIGIIPAQTRKSPQTPANQKSFRRVHFQ